jgi:hypothetical protein
MAARKSDMRKIVERDGAKHQLKVALLAAMDGLYRTEGCLEDDSVYRETLRARGIISALIDDLDEAQVEYYERWQRENEHIRAVLGNA